MTITEALDAIRNGASASSLESDTIEFKQEEAGLKRTLELISDAVVCFANAGGGRIVVGVADKGAGEAAIPGVSASLTDDILARGIFDRTSPALSVPIETLDLGSKTLLVVTVPKGAALYSNVKGTATRRVGAECRPFTPEQQRQALASRGLHDWSAVASGATTAHIDGDELARVRRLLLAAGREDLARADPEGLLRDLRLAEDGQLAWAGLLLLGTTEALRELAPQYGYSYQYRPSPGSESTARIRGSRPLLAAIDQILDAVEARRSVHSLNLAGGVQLQLHDYPSPAVRELVVNAFLHRDYETHGTVDIDHSPERLAISSPGGLVYGVTPDNILTHPSTPRNRLLLDVVTTLQIAERAGQGVDRAYREMLRSGKQPPEHEDLDTRVLASLSGGAGHDAFVRYLTSDLPEDLAADLDVLLALDQLRTKRSISADELSKRVQRPPAQAQRVLGGLADRGVLQPTARTARRSSPRYGLSTRALTSLGRSVSYHRATGDDRDQKVADHIAEYGYITNQSLRRLFDLTMYQARDLLRELQNRDLLVKLDDRSGGRGIRYGAGPKLGR